MSKKNNHNRNETFLKGAYYVVDVKETDQGIIIDVFERTKNDILDDENLIDTHTYWNNYN
jgi:hypothetical protein